MLRFNGFKCLLALSILCYLTHPVLSDCRDVATFDVNFDYFPDKVFFDNGKCFLFLFNAIDTHYLYIKFPVFSLF